MSDVIPKPGLYRQQNGKPADVKWVGEGKALGFDSNGEETCWEAASGKWYAMTASATCPVHITGPWIPDPPPNPFRISEHGIGVYETRDGREATVDRKDGPVPHPWSGTVYCGSEGVCRLTWMDGGTWRASCERGSTHDLVRYLRPLPKPEQPQEEWTPTNELVFHNCYASDDGSVFLGNSTGVPTYRLVQKWSNGTDFEWRPVPLVIF